MESMGSASLTGETAAEILGKVPIMRGWAGATAVSDWATVGTGLHLARVAELQAEVKTGDLEAEWEQWSKLLKPDFVDFVRNGQFKLYGCVDCGAGI